MAIAQENENWMGAPFSNVKDGMRWGISNGLHTNNGEFREQKIGDKVIRHRIKRET